MSEERVSQALEVWIHALDPMRAEVRVRVPWSLEAGVEVRGRLMGPRCRFATTVEVAYPFRPVEGAVFAAVIPEPSLWEPACPFIYEGPLECWRQGEVNRREWVRVRLWTLKPSPRGLLLNGHPVQVRASPFQEGSETELLKLRADGYNAIIAGETSAELEERAERLGFFIVGPDSIPKELGK